MSADTISTEKKKQLRKIVAIGDLHGDFWRLIRILDDEGLFIKDTWAWNPDVKNVDLVLLGDYFDWRGEPLEGDPTTWPLGIKRIAIFIMRLWREIKRLRENDETFTSRFHPLIGNHDLMMLEGHSLFKYLQIEEIQDIIGNYQSPFYLRKSISRKEYSGMIADKILKFLNWYTQGGDMTIASFGGLKSWKEAIDGETGDFLRNNLLTGVVLNGKIYMHSLPDQSEFWKPIEEINVLEGEELERAREAIVWGRRIWGYDVYTGMKRRPPPAKEVDKMFEMMKVSGAVVGHTPINSKTPLSVYGGRLINIDIHGIPGSLPYVEEY